MYYSRERIIKRLTNNSPIIFDFTRRTDPAFIPEIWDNLRNALTITMPHVLHIWTKRPDNLLKIGKDLLQSLLDSGVIIAAQVTINGYDHTTEPKIPHNIELQNFINFIGGPDHITWRFDPIIPKIDFRDRFLKIGERVSNLGIQRLVINTIAPPGRYKRVDARLRSRWDWWEPTYFGFDKKPIKLDSYIPMDIELPNPDTWHPWAKWQMEVLERVLELARPFGFSVFPCAETSWLTKVIRGLGKAGCASRDWFYSLGITEEMNLKPTRKGCGCVDTIDLGSYGYWRRCGSCLYCYAG